MSSSSFLSRRSLLRAALAGGGLTAVGALAACGSGTASTTLTAKASTSLRGASLKLMVNQPHVLAFTKVLGPAFKKEFGGTLHVTAIPYDQLTSKQILDVQGGDGEFDVFDYFYFGLGALVDAGALVDLTAYIKAHAGSSGATAIDTSDLLPSIYDTYTLLGGKRYGLPFDGDTHVLYYNKELLDEAGQQPPKTWDEYDAVAKAVTQKGAGAYYGAAVEGQQVPMILGCSFINRLAGYGGTLVDSSGKPTLTSEAAHAALQHLIDVSPYALPTPLQVGFDEANTGFLSGKAAMLDTWTDLGLKAQDPASSKVVDKWGVVTLPVGGSNTTPRTSLDAGFGLGVSTASKKIDQAAAFVAWATAAKQNLLLASTAGSGIDPNRRSTLTSPAYAKASAPATATIAAGLDGDPLAWPKDAKAPKRLQDLVDQIALAMQGKKSVEKALATAQASWEQEA